MPVRSRFLWPAFAVTVLYPLHAFASDAKLFDKLNPLDLVATVVYAALGIAMMFASFKLFDLIVPYSMRKELEEDQNTALGIVAGAMMLGVALIIAAAIGG